MDEKRLTEIEELASKATPGPWEVGAYNHISTTWIRSHGEIIAQCLVPSIGATAWQERVTMAEANATFAAHARTDIPALCAALRQAWRERDEHRERANAAQIAWDAHKAMDCAIKCAREIEELLGTSSPVEAARRIREMVKECSDLHIENGRLEAQCAAMRSALEHLYKLNADGVYSVPDPHYAAITNAAAALSSDAGKALAEYVKLLERVLDLAYRYFGEAWKDHMDLKWSPSAELIGAIKAAKEVKPNA